MWPFKKNKTPFFLSGFDLDKTIKVAPLQFEEPSYPGEYFGSRHSAPLHDAPGLREELQSSTMAQWGDNPAIDVSVLRSPSTGRLNWRDAERLNQINRPMKIAGRKPNAANLVLRDMLLTFPELATGDYEDVWFTGSRVWHHVYGELVQQSSDTDIYCETYATYCKVLGQYGWWGCPAVEKNWDRSVGGNDTIDVRTAGKKITTPKHGVIDIWYPLGTLSVSDMIKSYPDASHSQAKCAFNFHQGLIILPNINANF
jgi:hypothetical protein